MYWNKKLFISKLFIYKLFFLLFIICMCFSFIIFSTCTKNNNDDEQEQNDVYNKVMKFKKGLSQKMLINTPTYILSKDDDDYHVDKSVILNRNCTHIDAVYTWVNGSDPNHIEKRKQAGFKVDTSEENRYRDFGALKYSLRSLHKYAPWINNIWIITDSQIPDFFDSEKESNIKFIFHESFFIIGHIYQHLTQCLLNQTFIIYQKRFQIVFYILMMMCF